MSEKRECRFCKHWHNVTSVCQRLTDGGMAWSDEASMGARILTDKSFGCNLFEGRERSSVDSAFLSGLEAQASAMGALAYLNQRDERRHELALAAMEQLIALGGTIGMRNIARDAVLIANSMLDELAKEKP